MLAIMKKALAATLCLALSLILINLAGCQVDGIAIEISKQENEVILTFRYEDSKELVDLTEIRVQESKNGPIIWDIRTYDPAVFAERRHEKFDIEWIKSHPIPMAKLALVVIGIVPPEFRQCAPSLGNQPRLEPGKSYDVFVRGAGHIGLGRFTM